MRKVVSTILGALLCTAAEAQTISTPSQPPSLSGAGFPTSACVNGQIFRATDTGQIWDCADGASVWINRVTGVVSSGAAAYNTGLLARYRMADCTSTTIPDSSGNGYTGAFGTGGSPYYGAAPVCNSGLDIDTSTGGQAYYNSMQAILPGGAITGMQTIIIYAKPSGGGAQPMINAGTLLTYNQANATYGSNISLRAADGNPALGQDGGGYNSATVSQQSWQGVMPMAFVYGTTPHIYYQGVEVTGYSLQAASPTVPSAGTMASLAATCCTYGNSFLGPIYYMETYSGILTAAQLTTESARINAELYGRGIALGNQLNINKPLVIWLGTSITEGYDIYNNGYIGGVTSYVGDAYAAFGASVQMVDGGLLSFTLAAAITTLQSSALNQISNKTPPIVILDFPTNDIVGASGTVTTAETNIQTACATLKAGGALPVVTTVLPRTVGGSSSTFSANRAAWNTWVRANALTYCSGLADPASDPIIGPDSAAANATYWATDGTHPLAAADAIAAPYYEAAITKLTGIQPVSGAACVNGASPAVCGAATSGVVAVPTGSNPTLVVDTTAVTNLGRILLTADESLQISGVTCNTTLANNSPPIVTARTPGTSFTIEVPATVSTNPVCVSWSLLN